MTRTVLALLLLWTTPVLAHDTWSDGTPVPDWVRKACCGPQDVHHLRADQVHAESAGYRIDGYAGVVPYDRAEPSPDGTYWIFYRQFKDGQQSGVYCFFAPPAAT